MLILHDAISIFISHTPNFLSDFVVGAVLTKLQISPLLPGLRMSTLAKNVSQVVLYENQVSDFVALLWMQTPLGPRTIIKYRNIDRPSCIYLYFTTTNHSTQFNRQVLSCIN